MPPSPLLLLLPQAALEQEQQQHASLVAGLQETAAVLQSSDDAEGRLRGQLVELAERVAVLTAAQVGQAGAALWLLAGCVMAQVVCCQCQASSSCPAS